MRLKELRVINNVTQQIVADAIGCSVTVYSRYEREEREPSIETLIKMADFFDVSLDVLFGRPSPEPNHLSTDEIELIRAYRNADNRAKEDALNTLLLHPLVEKGEEKRA